MRRKTTLQKVLEGDAGKLGRHKLQQKLESEPIAQDGLPHAPKHLGKRAREVYEFWREQLELMQIDHRPDAQALEAAARHYARAVAADIVVDREGFVIDEPVVHHGEIIKGLFRKKKHPAVAVSNASWLIVKAFVVEFGLTPVSRTRITVDRKSSDADELRKLISGPRLTPDERRGLQ